MSGECKCVPRMLLLRWRFLSSSEKTKGFKQHSLTQDLLCKGLPPPRFLPSRRYAHVEIHGCSQKGLDRDRNHADVEQVTIYQASAWASLESRCSMHQICQSCSDLRRIFFLSSQLQKQAPAQYLVTPLAR